MELISASFYQTYLTLNDAVSLVSCTTIYIVLTVCSVQL
jgi:hypothetical protein